MVTLGRFTGEVARSKLFGEVAEVLIPRLSFESTVFSVSGSYKLFYFSYGEVGTFELALRPLFL